MHIAFLTPEFPHEEFNNSAGLGTSIKNLATSLINKDLRVSVFVYGQEKDQEFTEQGIELIGIKQRKYKILGWYLYRKHLQKVINAKIETENIDLVEAPDWTGITAFMKLNAPLVIRLHGSDAYFCKLEGRKQKTKNRLFEGIALKNADFLTAVSAYSAEVTKQVFKLERSIKVIPNGISLDEFHGNVETKIIRNRVLYFGTIIRKKGVLELAEIFNILIQINPDTELVLIGKDVIDIFENASTIKLFKNRLTQKALRAVKFISEVPYEEIREYIASAEVVVLPSFAEALPMTWLEAMAMQKPLVTSDIGWAKEIMIDKKTGFTVSPNNHEIFAGRVLELLENPKKAKIMGKAARMQVERRFSSSVVVEQNISFYQAIIDKSSAY